jgi:hypothetical protein
VKIQPQLVVTPGKQTTNKPINSAASVIKVGEQADYERGWFPRNTGKFLPKYGFTSPADSHLHNQHHEKIKFYNYLKV